MKHCKKCGKKIGLTSTKCYVDLDNFVKSINEMHTKKKGKTLLCSECFDAEFIKAGGEIRDYDKINSSSTIKYRFLSKMVYNNLEEKQFFEPLLEKTNMEPSIQNERLELNKKMLNLYGKIECPKCGSNNLSYTIRPYGEKRLVTLYCGNCPYMWDIIDDKK